MSLIGDLAEKLGIKEAFVLASEYEKTKQQNAAARLDTQNREYQNQTTLMSQQMQLMAQQQAIDAKRNADLAVFQAMQNTNAAQFNLEKVKPLLLVGALAIVAVMVLK